MKTAQVHITGISPLSQSRGYDRDVEKLTKERPDDYEKRTWMNRLHVDAKGNVFIPPMAFKNCLSEAAKYLSIRKPGKGQATYTKHFEAGVLVTEPLILDVKKNDVSGEWIFVPADGKRGGGKRVWKNFPVIQQWGGDVTFFILDEEITQDVFMQHLEQAGQFIGVGRFRPRNNGFYGRFKVDNIVWG